MSQSWLRRSIPCSVVVKEVGEVAPGAGAGANTVFKPAKTTYPEIRYLFLNESVELDAESEEKDVFIVELDSSGEAISSVKCLSDNTQCLNYEISNKNSIKNIVLTTTKSELTIPAGVGSVQQLTALFNSRNTQIEKIMGM